MMKNSLSLIFALLLNLTVSAQPGNFKPEKSLVDSIKKNLTSSVEQYRYMAGLLAPDQFPKTYHAKTDKLETSNSGWWCSGFYPGTLLELFESTKGKASKAEADRILKVLAKEQYNTSTHDLGFMMFCSFGAANRLQPSEEYKQILLNSARSLSTRFNPKLGVIRSWDSKPADFLVIIDNMMNLELLFWASRVSGDQRYRDIAIIHADNTIKNHFRADNSSYHVLNYDAENGGVKDKRTAQGFAKESAWARGQAWGLYGFTVMYRETKDKKYLDQANKIAAFIVNHPNLPADKVPYWDYNAPNIPDALRDASAGAIMASALLELCKYVDKSEGKNYFNTAQTVLRTLSSGQYLAAKNTNGGFILKHGVGHLPAGTEVDVPLTYADYYFVEAMKRYTAFK